MRIAPLAQYRDADGLQSPVAHLPSPSAANYLNCSSIFFAVSGMTSRSTR